MKNSVLEKHIDSLRAGDMRAFDAVYEQTNKSVYFAILYIVRDKMYAEDILQDTFVRALQSLHSYQSGTNFTGWLIKIGKNLALNHIKRAKRETATDFDTDTYKYGTDETKIPFIFDMAAKHLAEDEYEILMLCQVTGYKRREVAQMLNLPIGTVTWKNNQALKKLKNILEKEDAV